MTIPTLELLGLGSNPNDGTGDTRRDGGLKINRNLAVTQVHGKTLNAGYFAYHATTGAWLNRTAVQVIQAAIDYAVANSYTAVWIPTKVGNLTLLPYDASAVTFNNAVRMIREGGRSDVWDIPAYGADTSGTLDARPSANAALSACAANGGGRVYAPKGTYSLTNNGSGDCIILNGQFIILEGDGHATLFQVKNAQNPTSVIRQVYGDSNWGIKIRNLRVDGNKANQTSGVCDGILLEGSNNSPVGAQDTGTTGIVENVVVLNCTGEGINAWGTVMLAEWKAIGCWIWGCDGGSVGGGAAIGGFGDGQIIGCTVGVTNAHGINTLGSTTVVGCKVYKWGKTVANSYAYRIVNHSTAAGIIAQEAHDIANTHGIYCSASSVEGAPVQGCSGIAVTVTGGGTASAFVGIFGGSFAQTYALSVGSKCTVRLSVANGGVTTGLISGTDDGSNDIAIMSATTAFPSIVRSPTRGAVRQSTAVGGAFGTTLQIDNSVSTDWEVQVLDGAAWTINTPTNLRSGPLNIIIINQHTGSIASPTWTGAFFFPFGKPGMPKNGTRALYAFEVDESGGVLNYLGETGRLWRSVVSKTANYTMLVSDFQVNCDPTAGQFTITLPVVGITAGQIYRVKHASASGNNVIVAPASGLIDLAASKTLSSLQSVDVQFDGTNYWIV